MAACGGGGNSEPALPPAPDPPPHVVDQFNFGVTPEIGNRSTVHFVWAGGRHSNRFLIEVGSTPGASDLVNSARSRTAASSSSRHHQDGTIVVDRGGGEIEVIKPFCWSVPQP